MHMDGSSEGSRREHRLVAHADPIRRPVSEELELTLAEELESWEINRLRVILLIGDVVEARSLLGNLTFRSRLELTVL